MASVINTNIASLNTQHNLSTSQAALNTSIQRLSSGLRINSAKDDAAGLAIGTRMDSQIRGANQAIRNSNDAVSLTQTADGALASVADNLQRIRELAVQSSNSTNTQVDRNALNSEVSQLQAEIQRTALQSSFNGVKILDGTFANQSFQVGANVGESINISSISNVQTSAMGLAYSSTVSGTVPPATGTATTALAAGDIKINGIDIGAVASVSAATGAAASLQMGINISTAINTLTAQTGVTATTNATGKITLTSVSATAANSAIVIDGTAGGATAAGLTLATTAAATATTATTAVGSMDVTSLLNSQLTIATMDRALAEVNTARANMGAIQNRFNSVITNLQTTAENITSAKSRIMDTDFAAETAKLSRGQILQQAGTAMLAQANSLPNNVLALLKG